MLESVERSKKQLQSKANCSTFLHFNCSYFSENSVKCIRVTEIAKEIKFEEVCGEVESKKVSRDNQSQNI